MITKDQRADTIITYFVYWLISDNTYQSDNISKCFKINQCYRNDKINVIEFLEYHRCLSYCETLARIQIQMNITLLTVSCCLSFNKTNLKRNFTAQEWLQYILARATLDNWTTGQCTTNTLGLYQRLTHILTFVYLWQCLWFV